MEHFSAQYSLAPNLLIIFLIKNQQCKETVMSVFKGIFHNVTRSPSAVCLISE